MSKKYKRRSRRDAGTTSGGSSSRAASSSQSVFDPDYTYIIKDLRRIGLIAGSYIVILVILAFILK